MLENGFTLSVDDRQYKIISTLGRGVNAIAYLAECTHDDLVSKCILKEYSPLNTEDFEEGKERFIESGRVQNKIRHQANLTNQTPAVGRIFEALGTAFIDVACYNGTTLDKLPEHSLPQYMAICKTIAKTVWYYHRAGFICLDLKPENIFILQNAPDDTITELIEFVDFDSIRNKHNKGFIQYSYTRDWAAPEQLNPYAAGSLTVAADIYTVGEIVFYYLFGRHSGEKDHRGFSGYPFDDCKKSYLRYTERFDIQALFTKLFRGTIRSSATNRFKSMEEVVALLEEINKALLQENYVVRHLPFVSPCFVGRDAQIKQMSRELSKNPVLFITGIGGIGKTTLIKNFLLRNRGRYDIIVFLEYDGDFIHTFCDDEQLQISAISRFEGERLEDYFVRKLKSFKLLCNEKRVLFALDNYNGRLSKDLSRIMNWGYDIIITTRNKPPKNSFPSMEIGAIEDPSELQRLITLNLERTPTTEENQIFDEINSLIGGHTLVLELITRQIASEKLDIYRALELIREKGFSDFSGQCISNYKDGEETYDTLSSIVTALFEDSGMSPEKKLILKVLSLFNVRGLETPLFAEFFPNLDTHLIFELSAKGWLYDGDRIRLHPVIAETVRNWKWSIDPQKTMDYHKTVSDILTGMEDLWQLKVLMRLADSYRSMFQDHRLNAIYYDITAAFYDTRLSGAYEAETPEEEEDLEKLLKALRSAVAEVEESKEKDRKELLTQYYFSLASVLMRSNPKNYDEAGKILKKVSGMIDEGTKNHCYYLMTRAWYYANAEQDSENVLKLTKEAETIAKKNFKTELEIIDIIHIPTANCLYNVGDYDLAKDKITEAIELCDRYPDMEIYMDKKKQLEDILNQIKENM